jgi:glutamine amidotransferase
MCRLSAWLGPPTTLDALLLDPPHSLREQSRHPRELPPGMLNADGHGFACYADGRAEPAVYRTVAPMWADDNLSSLAPVLRATCVVASTRSATRRMPVSATNTAPFAHGPHALVHNGEIADFHARVMAPLRAAVGPAYAAEVRGNTDSEHAFALLRSHLDGRPLADALRATLARLDGLIRDAGVTAQLNLIASDGRVVVAVGDAPPTLYVCDRGARGAFVASEALDPGDDWRPVEPETMVTLERGRAVREEPIARG